MSVKSPFAAIAHPLPSNGTLLPLVDTSDAAAIAALLVVEDPWRTLGYQEETVSRYLMRPDPALHRFRLMREGVLVGVLGIRYPWLRGPYIELIGVTPEARGFGLGGAVVTWIEEEARGEAANLWACVSESNADARRFYARRGFIEVAPIDDLVARGHAEILLRKRLLG
ncbi:MAG: GNAT family N-acetyltransferase [Rhodospirillales bacterium]|nr:GNAT family N-acetyltransferase [Rhodospirillales bacterium]